ncbi:MAG: ribonuclease III [Epulopiscium sp. Nele67-Bin005]|nr:MAG: ribonuclease III [Epulopiscium sp. Nele67-Bin005]
MQNIKDLMSLIPTSPINAREYSPLALAYIGDAIYETFVRTHIMQKGNTSVNKLHKMAKGFVCAEAQAEVYHAIEGILTEDELSVLKRGRNAKSASSPKNSDVRTYRCATGVEALIGFLYLDNQLERVQELMVFSINHLEQKND